jgi:hypothetical protein
MWVAIHKCMEAMLRISLYSYFLSPTSKNNTSFFLPPMFSLQHNWRRRQNRFCLEMGGGGYGEVAQAVNTHVSKCKNDKIKREKKINIQKNQVLVLLSFEEGKISFLTSRRYI